MSPWPVLSSRHKNPVVPLEQAGESLAPSSIITRYQPPDFAPVKPPVASQNHQDMPLGAFFSQQCIRIHLPPIVRATSGGRVAFWRSRILHSTRRCLLTITRVDEFQTCRFYLVFVRFATTKCRPAQLGNQPRSICHLTACSAPQLRPNQATAGTPFIHDSFHPGGSFLPANLISEVSHWGITNRGSFDSPLDIYRSAPARPSLGLILQTPRFIIVDKCAGFCLLSFAMTMVNADGANMLP